VVRHVEWKYYRRRRAAWPFAAVNLPFRLARTASRMFAGNWSTEIQAPGDPKQSRNVAVRRSRYLRRPARLFNPFEDPEFLETTGVIRFGPKRDTPGKWSRSSRPIGATARYARNTNSQSLLAIVNDRVPQLVFMHLVMPPGPARPANERP